MPDGREIEPLHRRVLAPIIRARIDEIKAEDRRLKAEILAMPPEERNAFSESCLAEIEDRELAELFEEVCKQLASHNNCASPDKTDTR